MDRPSQLFDRIRRQKARPGAAQHFPEARIPAPVAPVAPQAPAPAPQASPAAADSPAQPAPTPQEPAAARPTTARPAGSHTLYSQVMRRHDRVGTRHLDKN